MANRIGIVGLGRIGSVFAAHLLEDGNDITLFTRSPEKAADLVKNGAKLADGPAAMAQCDFILTSVSDDAALESVAGGDNGLLRHMRPGAVHISTSTVGPDISRGLAARHAEAGQGFVAAPIMGNPDAAKARMLFILASGNAGFIEKASPVLGRLGQRVFELGEDAGAASVMKLAANALVAMTLQGMGEVLALLEKTGIGAKSGFEILTSSLFDGRVHKVYGGKIVAGQYDPPGMTVPLAMKDLRLALAEAERTATPMPSASLVHDRFVAAVARGWAHRDWSVLGLLAANDAGLPG